MSYLHRLHYSTPFSFQPVKHVQDLGLFNWNPFLLLEVLVHQYVYIYIHIEYVECVPFSAAVLSITVAFQQDYRLLCELI